MVLADLPDMAHRVTRDATASFALVAASLFGVLLALGASIDIGTPRDGSAVAMINDQPIERAEYERALVAVANDKRNPLNDADRERILNRLIEEELLIQRGVEIGLVDRDRSVRGAIVTAVIDHILSASRSDPVDEVVLRKWYTENADRYRPQPQIHLRDVTEDDQIILPNGLVPVSTLQDYVGPHIVSLALNAMLGVPFTAGTGRSYEVVARKVAPPPPFDEIKNEIETAYRRDTGDQAFREYLDWLENRASIERQRP
ncbi:MAG: SurA N-terminal domain-containing protein [Pseudomonadota bacterium]